MDYVYVDLEDLFDIAAKKNEKPFIIILDGVEDPRNFGAILRTAEVAGVHGIVIPKARSVSLNDTVMKTSTGAAALIPVARVSNINQTIEKIKKHDLWVVGVEVDGTKRYDQADYANSGVALVMGSEGHGLSKLVKEHCDYLVTLPMKGTITSLNVSVSAGIMMFEVNRQRNFQ